MKVAELLVSEASWCKGSMARNADGFCVLPVSKDACQWCLLGAVAKCYGEFSDFYFDILDRLDKSLEKLYCVNSIIVFNDAEKTTFEMVRRVVEHAGV